MRAGVPAVACPADAMSRFRLLLALGSPVLVACDPISLGSLVSLDADAAPALAATDAALSAGSRAVTERARSDAGQSLADAAATSATSSDLPDAGVAQDASPTETRDAVAAEPSARLPDAASLRPSCVDDPLCGDRLESCCSANLVPRGGFVQGEAGDAVAYVSSFYLDNYEVTVERFLQFVGDYDAWRAAGNPVEGAGALPAASGTGWQRRWDAALPASGEALLEAATNCGDVTVLSTLTGYDLVDGAPVPVAEREPQRPINCVTWFEAHLFCTWDGARLPTELEWEFAAAGGSEERQYPWGDAPEPDAERAVFDCNFVERTPDAGGAPNCLPGVVPSVGSVPRGRGRFGQDDLAGSIAEWTLDGAELLAEGCVDCVEADSDAHRMFRGGYWSSRQARDLQAATRYSTDPGSRLGQVGFRCARRNFR